MTILQGMQRIEERIPFGYRVLLCLLLCALIEANISADAFAQSKRSLRIGVSLMGTAYSGDLTPEGESFYRFYPGFNLSLQSSGKRWVQVQGNIGYGKFVSQNRLLEPVPGYAVNTFVSTAFFFVDAKGKFKAFPKRSFNPFASVGLGLLNFTPKDADGNALSDNLESRTVDEQYSSITINFPLSAGFDYHFHHIVGIGLEYTYRLTVSDYLDNIKLLGTRQGNDQLHNFMLTLYFTLPPKGGYQVPTRGGYSPLRGKERRF